MRPKSLRSRMTATFALSFAALIALFSALLLWSARISAQRNADTLLLNAANNLRSEYEEAQKGGFALNWSNEMEEIGQANLALLVVDEQGVALHKTPGRVPPLPAAASYEWRVKTVSLADGMAIIGFHWEKTEQALVRQAFQLTALSLLMLFVTTLGAWSLVGRTLSPIYRLSVQAESASADNLNIRLNSPSQDAEITHLVETLNALMGRLSGAISARERFYAAASHELRTPLQTLNGSLELALMRPREAEEYRKALENAYTQSERLTALVQALLLLNQLETRSVQKKESVSLNETCERWLAELSGLAMSRQLNVTTEFPESVTIEAIPTHADILVRNLIENSLKYATAGSDIRLTLCVERNVAILTLFNECVSLRDWSEERLFEPFYRPDSSRNSDTGGNGLGLAICKAIATANGWTVHLKQESNGVLAEVVVKR